jgi:hypothetical protein
MSAASLTYEFASVEGAIRFVARGTSLGLMATLRYEKTVHVVTEQFDVETVYQLAKATGGIGKR